MKKITKIMSLVGLTCCSFSMIIHLNIGNMDAFLGYLNAVIWCLVSLINDVRLNKYETKFEVIEELTNITENNEELGTKIKELIK